MRSAKRLASFSLPFLGRIVGLLSFAAAAAAASPSLPGGSLRGASGSSEMLSVWDVPLGSQGGPDGHTGVPTPGSAGCGNVMFPEALTNEAAPLCGYAPGLGRAQSGEWSQIGDTNAAAHILTLTCTNHTDSSRRDCLLDQSDCVRAAQHISTFRCPQTKPLYKS